MSEPWSKDEVKLLKKLVRNKTQRQIAEKLGRSVSSVLRKAYRLGLKKNKEARPSPRSKAIGYVI